MLRLSAGQGDCAPTELKVRKAPLGYRHLAPLGRSEKKYS
jgi:hypothetical protein